jgi:hypothetical protein
MQGCCAGCCLGFYLEFYIWVLLLEFAIKPIRCRVLAGRDSITPESAFAVEILAFASVAAG